MSKEKTTCSPKLPCLLKRFENSIYEMIPTIHEQGEEAIEHAYGFVPALGAEMEGAIEAHFAQHGDEIKAFYDGHDQVDAAEHVIGGVLDRIVQEIDDRVKGRNGMGLDDYSDASAASLRKINEQLESLIRKSPRQMTKSERIQRRLIVTWIRALDSHFEKDKMNLELSMVFDEQ